MPAATPHAALLRCVHAWWGVALLLEAVFSATHMHTGAVRRGSICRVSLLRSALDGLTRSCALLGAG